MLRIGLTGGIGSGKSTVARLFEILNIPVYYADAASKRIMTEDPEVKAAIIEAFGAETYTDGRLNRGHLSSIVFNDTAKLAKLNEIVHPATIADAESWMSKQNSPYIIKEAALIFESGSNKALDLVIGVFAPEAMRIARIVERDKVDEASVLSRMKNQMNEAEKMRLCNYIIINHEEELVIPQVLKLHEVFQKG